MDKIRVLFCGDSLYRETGFAYVATSFMKRLADTKKYEIAYCVIVGNDTGNENLKVFGKNFYENFKNMKIFNNQITIQEKAESFDNTIKEYKPHIVITIADPWNLDQIAYSAYKNSFFWIAYLTIETPYYPEHVIYPTVIMPTIRKSLKDILFHANMIMPVTQIGKRALESMGLKTIKENIYNGVDWEKRIENIKITKAEVFGNIDYNDKFIFMTMGQNTERKKIDIVIEAYAKFLEKYKKEERQNFKLYLHTDVNERANGTDLMGVVSKLNIEPYVIIPKTLLNGRMIKKEDLYKIYYVCDCYIGLPAGEGFGYGFVESLMHSKPVIYHDYGGQSDYLKDIALPVKTKALFGARNVYIQWGIADIDDAATQMKKIVTDEHLRKKLSIDGYMFAKKNLKWDVIFPKFLYYMESGFKQFIENNSIIQFNLKRIA